MREAGGSVSTHPHVERLELRVDLLGLVSAGGEVLPVRMFEETRCEEVAHSVVVGCGGFIF